MVQPRSSSPRALPRGIVVLGSVVLLVHLFAVAVLALAAPSGPWPTAFGTSMALEPQFAQSISTVTTRRYLQPLKMTHNYHFVANRPALPGVFFEVRLKDRTGQEIKTVRFPDQNANFWVRHRQGLIAQALADDQPVEARPGEVIPAPNQKVKTVPIWDMTPPDPMLRLRSVPEHLIPRDRPVSRPSEWSLVLARAYVRYLCRAHGAASAELIRHTRDPIMPAVLFTNDPPPNAFEDLIANYGELSR
jgi:hypothetical protein